ncbi:NUDIX hydrolase [Limosilactobacillus fermentum]|uniref:NUDIX hydrolase n=1 Tax=Limosilactobacillus fermentum TaxID=1613 RepID=UPI00292EA4FD|nr:NUDIX hydrolase [Limosilactobacillus fermentum]WNY95482.1 NUDIX hydrolase [Limosilactobacillus fermentum]
MDFEEKVTGHQPVFSGHLIDVEVQDVLTPAGNHATREVVHHAPAVAILALTDDDQMILEQQWRAPVKQVTLEIPAGKVDDRDQGDLRACAVRELNEETGLAAEHLDQVNATASSVGFSDEVITLFVARGLRPVDHALPKDQDEELSLLKVSLKGALEMVATGQIIDMKTVMAIYYWASQRVN